VELDPDASTADKAMVACDGCDIFFHLACINLKSFPTSKTWFCSCCTGKEELGKQPPSRDNVCTYIVLHDCMTTFFTIFLFFVLQLLCNICQCTDDEIVRPCSSCRMWFHKSCLGVDGVGGVSVGDVLCPSCCKNEAGVFDFESSLKRLRAAFLLGSECLVRVSESEKQMIDVHVSEHFQHQPTNLIALAQTEDDYSATLLRVSGNSDLHPVITTADGNCLFNSISLYTCGTEARAMELRVRTCLEIALNKPYYQQLATEYTDVDDMPIDGQQSVLERNTCRTKSSGIGEILGLASVIRHGIIVVVPNHPNLAQPIKDFTINPRLASEADYVMLMWTRTAPEVGDIWFPNHFVPLVFVSPSTFETCDLDDDSLNQSPTACHSHQDQGSFDNLPDNVSCDLDQDMACDSDPARTTYYDLSELIRAAESNSSILSCPPSVPENSGVFTLTCGIEEAKNDGWRWRCTGGRMAIYIDGEGQTVHCGDSDVFYRKVRNGRMYQNEFVNENEDIFTLSFRYFSHAATDEFTKRITTIRKILPREGGDKILLEYLRKNRNITLSFPAHGNAKNAEPFKPTSKSSLKQATVRLEENQSTRHVYKNVPGLRDPRQVYNLASRKRKLPECRCDPWHAVMSQHMIDQMSPEGERFVRAVHLEEGQTSVVCYTAHQIRNISLLGHGNPAHIDTTFGSAAYITFIAFDNTRLVDKNTGTTPLFVGPAMIHSKEKDSHSILHYLTHVKDNMPIEPYFISDECKMLEKRIHEVWPTVHHALGREHLIARFRDRGRQFQVCSTDIDNMKAEVFGPSNTSETPLLESTSELQFERRLDQLSNKWNKEGQSVNEMGEWIRTQKAGIYKREGCRIVTDKMGITVAWQQGQERKNRDLKAMRVKSTSRSVVDVMKEVRSIVRLQEEEELCAIQGKGQYRLVRSLRHHELDERQWTTMDQVEKERHLSKYFSSKPGVYLVCY
jgi:hypothetical protein